MATKRVTLDPVESGPFMGFSEATLDFLRGIAEHNDKAWFDAHRAGYEAHYLQPAVAFVSAIGPRLQAEVSPAVQYEAKVNGSLFRINRDVRFSRDKSPYKAHLDMWFWQGNRKGWDSPGFYLRLLPDQLILGAGMHHFGAPQLAAYRRAVVNPSLGADLASLSDGLRAAGYSVGYDEGHEPRKTVPKGFDPAHERARYLLWEGLPAMWMGPVPPEASTPAFVDWCVAHFKATSPINDWLIEALAIYP